MKYKSVENNVVLIPTPSSGLTGLSTNEIATLTAQLIAASIVAPIEIWNDDTKQKMIWKTPNFEAIALSVGIQAQFLVPRGAFGTGAGWADEAFINLIPVLAYNNNQTERGIFMFYALARFRFDDVDPQVAFILYTNNAPLLGDAVRLRLSLTYNPVNGQTGAVPDEIIEQTVVLDNLSNETREPNVFFDIDRSLIQNQDTMLINLERFGGDAADTYGDDIGIGQSGIVSEVSVLNP